jgi:hypothetical protein
MIDINSVLGYAWPLIVCPGEEITFPIFLRPPLGQPRAKVSVVAATATFLAYANQALRLDQSHAESMLEGLMVLSLDDV